MLRLNTDIAPVAKGAQIVLVSSYPASSSDDGLYDSESYIINNLYKTAKIMSVSYGACELAMGVADADLERDVRRPRLARRNRRVSVAGRR